MAQSRTLEVRESPAKVERAFLVGVQMPGMAEEEVIELLDELRELTETLGIGVVGSEVIRLTRPQSRFLVGSGKAEEIVELARGIDADVLVIDESLTPSQQRNWESLSDMCVIDRQEVILDIFAERAQTREAELQIELARSEYSLPRLKRRWTHLSRQRGASGGRGMRGEGEQQIEVDARLVRQRIATLHRQLEEVRKQRGVQRKRRLRKPVPVAAIVGYTNAGKSSLLNCLSGANVLAEDKLFATLDPTVRRVELPNQQEILLADTVGFIRRLPHQLVEAFKATLEEVVLADMIIEVLDASSPQVEKHHVTTGEVLQELGVHDVPSILVFNKIDLIDNSYLLPRLRRRHPCSVFLSAKTGQGIGDLLELLADELEAKMSRVSVVIPHDRHDVTALVHRTSNVLELKFEEGGTRIRAAVPPPVRAALQDFLVEEEQS